MGCGCLEYSAPCALYTAHSGGGSGMPAHASLSVDGEERERERTRHSHAQFEQGNAECC